MIPIKIKSVLGFIKFILLLLNPFGPNERLQFHFHWRTSDLQERHPE